jgi:hypothetical protein
MRHWRHFWHTLTILGQHNPPQLVETTMLSLSMMLFVVWIIHPVAPYLLLGLIYTVGACASILVRESLIPSSRPRPTQVAAMLLLLVSLYGFADLIFSSI